MRGGSPLLKRDGDSKYPSSYLGEWPARSDLQSLHHLLVLLVDVERIGLTEGGVKNSFRA